jgi:hypothetical protein
MVEMMLEQMMQHDQMMESMPAKLVSVVTNALRLNRG